MLELLISPFAVVLSLSTSLGVLVHETKVDKLAAMSIVSPSLAVHQASALLEGMPHVHIENMSSLARATGELRTQTPGLTPRRNRDENYHLQKHVTHGVHSFDSYNLPLKAVR